MNVLSAAEAVSPALSRTKRLLFQPFRWGTYLKLCAVAVFSEGLYNNFNSNRNTHAYSQSAGSFSVPALSAGMIAGIIAIAIAAIVLGFLLFYVVVRLRFALFHCLVHQTTSITPGWRLYREQASRFFVFNIVVGIVYVMVAAACVLPFVLRFIRLYHESHTAGRIDFGELFSLVLPFLPVILLLIFLGFLVDLVVRDFMMPHIALENAPVVEAWEAALAKIAADKGAFFFYAVLRIMLPLVAMICLFIVLFIPVLIVVGIPGMMLAGLNVALAEASGAMLVFGRFIEVLLGFLIFALGLMITFGFLGPLCIAMRNYALVFYGGRYQPLGDLLYPPAPPAPVNAAVSPA
jgi:MFS family permease